MQKSVLRLPVFHHLLAAFVITLLTALLVGEYRVHGQEPTIAVDVKVVNVLATVRDKHGQIVNSLTKDDFTLQEDGRAETIKYFSRESDLPLTLGLLVDTSLSQRRVLGEERSASYSFLDKILRPKDQAFVIHFDHEAELLQDLTSSKEKLQAALDKLETPSGRLCRVAAEREAPEDPAADGPGPAEAAEVAEEATAEAGAPAPFSTTPRTLRPTN
jgi:VWFA-related protein